jgi:hypothetical protein
MFTVDNQEEVSSEHHGNKKVISRIFIDKDASYFITDKTTQQAFSNC